MKKLSKISFILAALILLAQVFLPVISYAVLIGSGTKYASPNNEETLTCQLKRPDASSGDKYTIGNQVVIKIKNSNNSNSYYCLRGGLGFGNINENGGAPASVDYTYLADLISEQTVKQNLNYLNESNPDSYHAICWLADNMYVPDAPNASDLKNKLLANAEITNSVLSDEDIEVVQQVALWYYTNKKAGNDQQYVINPSFAAGELANSYLKVNGASITNEDRRTQINKLYEYLVNTAATGSYVLGNNVQTPSLAFEKNSLTPGVTEATLNTQNDARMIGPFKVNKTQGNVGSITASFSAVLNGVDIDELGITTGLVQIVTENGAAFSSIDDVINADKFYVRAYTGGRGFGSTYGDTEVNSFTLNLSYEVEGYYKTLATVWTAGDEDQPVLKVEKEKVNGFTDTDTVTITEDSDEFDLSLAKFITTAAGNNLEGTNSRAPKLELAELRSENSTTSVKFKRSKTPVTLKVGDKVVYTIRIYNEGQVDGYATSITDYLSEELDFVPIAESTINDTYGWSYSENGRKVTTDYLKNTLIKAYDPDMTEANAIDDWQKATDGDDGLYYADVKIECKINENARVGYVIPNIAAITGDLAEGEDQDDRDSQPLDSITEGDLREYDITHKFQDDDDYELVEIEPDKVFDLALRKYITGISTENSQIELLNSREPEIDFDGLDDGTSKTAYYAHRKDPVEVRTGDIVTYSITVYNEGEQEGRATKIVDQLPTGLKFENVVDNDNYVLDTYNVNTNTVYLKEKTTNTDLDAKANGREPDSTTVRINCKVVAEVGDTDQVLTNIAWISEEYNAEEDITITNQTRADRDSEPATAPSSYSADNLNTTNIGYTGNNNKSELEDSEYYYKGQQDDDDFEKVILKTIKGSYDIVLVKEDADGEQLNETATFEVNGVEKRVTGRLPIVENKEITPTTVDIVDEYIIKETVPPDKYCPFDGTIKIKVYKVQEIDEYVVDRIEYYVNDVLITPENERNDVKVKLKASDGNIYVEVKDYQFDLALRKYISKIERNGKDVEFDSRVPQVDTSKLNTIDPETGKLITTATYVHPKNVLTVKNGDIVTYKLRIYNEGELDGYASEVTDYLPSGLGFVADENVNPNWLITSSSDDIETVTIDGKEVVSAKEGKYLEITNTSLDDELIKKYGDTHSEGDKWQQSTNDENDGLFYQELEVTCVILAPNTYEGTLKNIAEITDDDAVNEYGEDVPAYDRDSDTDSVWDDGKHTPGEESGGYTPGEQDDDDFEPVQLKYFDLALRKFITAVNDEEVTSRIPEFTGEIDENGNYIYQHPKDPVYVVDKDVVTYTIRIFNEGTIDGYAEEIEDDIPEGLIFLPEHDINKEYRWVMYRVAREGEDLEGKATVVKDNVTYVETDDASEAVIIRTDYLSSEQERVTGRENIIRAFDKNNMESPNYRDVKVAFKVSQADIPEDNEDRIIINKAQITDDSDDDEDSTPNEWEDDDDDQDEEKIYVREFDLALFKWVSKTIVTVDGKTTTTETGFEPNVGLTEQTGDKYRDNDEAEPIASVVIDKKKLNKTVVKFVYTIKVVNEGDIEGYATEITDYIPEGLKFVPEDNPLWSLGEKEGTITTRALEKTLLEPGKSASIQVVFTWINGANNLGLKTNVAAITEDYNDKNVDDDDSTPGNEDMSKYTKEQEDDDDFALVILTLKTGKEIQYIGLVLVIVAILATGAITIKKYVL